MSRHPSMCCSMFLGRLGLGRGPLQLQQVAQLEAPPALHVILQAGLAELEVSG